MENHITELKPITHISGSLMPGTPSGPHARPHLPAQMKTCAACSNETTWTNAAGQCWECQARDEAVKAAEREAQEILEDLDGVVDKHLRAMGLSTRELGATWSRVGRGLVEAVPRDVLKDLADGVTPEHGFALGSDTGTGKTMMVAAIMRGFMRARIRRHAAAMVEHVKAHPDTRLAMKPAPAWVCWPDAVAFIRAHAVDGAADDLLARAESAPLLVLDDLGRERIKGSYLEDWAASQLDRVVNHRYREMLPTIWTTNLREQSLAGIYGAALVSRLTEDAPLQWVDGLPSMRIRA